MMKAFSDATIVRPSVIYGHEDRFINLIGSNANLPLGYPIMNKGKTTLRPIHVSDVAEGILRVIKSEASVGKLVDFTGPKQYSFNQMMDLISKITMRNIKCFHVDSIALIKLYTIQNSLLSWRVPYFEKDQILQFNEAENSSADNLTLADVGMRELRTFEEDSFEFLRYYREAREFREPNVL